MRDASIKVRGSWRVPYDTGEHLEPEFSLLPELRDAGGEWRGDATPRDDRQQAHLSAAVVRATRTAHQSIRVGASGCLLTVLPDAAKLHIPSHRFQVAGQNLVFGRAVFDFLIVARFAPVGEKTSNG